MRVSSLLKRLRRAALGREAAHVPCPPISLNHTRICHLHAAPATHPRTCASPQASIQSLPCKKVMFLPYDWVLTKPPELPRLLSAFAGKPSEAVVANLTAAVQVVIRSSAEDEEEDEEEEEEGEEGPGEESTGEEGAGEAGGEEGTGEGDGGSGSGSGAGAGAGAAGGAAAGGAGGGGAGAGGAPGERPWASRNWQCLERGLTGAACGDLVARFSTDFFSPRECDLYPCFAVGAACG